MGLRVVFRFAEGAARGRSIDISESGLLATFDRDLDVWLNGWLAITDGEQVVRLQVRVARVNGRAAALSFHRMSAKDLAIIRSMIGECEKEAS
jgi:hypothetical protein